MYSFFNHLTQDEFEQITHPIASSLKKELNHHEKSSFGCLGFCYSFMQPAHYLLRPNNEVPAYAKWGMLALKETKQKYPEANVIDYLHIGSETKDDTTIEKFKLWLKDDRHEFGVIIHITFKTQTGEIVNIDFQETDR